MEPLSQTSAIIDFCLAPLALDTGVRSGRIQRGQTLLLEGVGGGFTWGSVLVDY